MSIDKLAPITAAVSAAKAGRAEPTPPAGTKAAQPQPADVETPVEMMERKLESVAKQLESYMRSVNRSLEFRVDSASGRTVVSVRDAETGDLIRQFPSEEVLHLAQMAEDQTVVLLNETA